ncbi:hypothetical protein GCM10009801_16430 [Streptomyces albiaxialis]|uniref:Carrier domain-containing protein n=1 Tax=Streptomyces albiaxialis TaxID=329523 RepID=A0ABN2VP42_9ACTN
MASLGIGRERAEELLASHPEVGVAGVNGPSSTVVSGPPEAVAAVVEVVKGAGGRARLVEVDYASHGPQVDEITGELGEVLAGVEPVRAPVAFYSTVTGARIETTGLDTGYWITNLRRPVRFADTVHALLDAGHRVFIEASPHPVLTLGMQETFEQAGVEVAVTVPTLRRDEGGSDQVAYALAQAYVAGVPVDWTTWLDEQPVVELPTYPFQHKRYWLEAGAGAGGAGAAGLGRTAHALLPASVRLSDGGLVLAGRIRAGTGGWLTGHTVAGMPVVPGGALAEWVLRAGDEVGCGEVRELTLREPLIPPEAGGGLLLQVSVEPPDSDGLRGVRVSSCAERDGDGGGAQSWTLHAAGLLAPHDGAPQGQEPDGDGTRPPAGARPVALDGFYERAEAAGCAYGPEFRGLRALWRNGHDLYAEVQRPEGRGGDEGFGIHPALLEAALQPAVLGDQGGTRLWTPFAWSGVSLWARGATTARVRLTPLAPESAADDRREVRVEIADAVGAPVMTVESVVLRPLDADALRAAGRRARGAGLRAAAWTPLALAGTDGTADGQWPVIDGRAYAEGRAPVTDALEGGPSVVLADVHSGSASGLVDAESAFALVREWLAEPRAVDATLVLLTRGAVDVGVPGDGTALDPVRAGFWGRLRHVQEQHPGRFLLLDLDPAQESGTTDPALRAAVSAAVERGEPQLALRAGRVLAPRWTRDEGGRPEVPDAAAPGTVLVSGGTGAWGGRVAEYLSRTGRAARLLLVSRRGPEAPGAAALAARIEERGVPVRVVAADLSEPGQAAALVASVDPAYPLTGVVHAAGTREGTSEQVWRTKATVAAELHAATEGVPSVRWFALFSEPDAAAVNEAGDGVGDEDGGALDHAAARAYCDALAAHRHALGLPATSVLWTDPEGADGTVGADGTEERTLDAVLPHPASHLLVGGAAGTRAVTVPAASPHSLVVTRPETVRRRGAAADAGDGRPEDWAARLAGLGQDERRRALLDLVRRHAAAVLGHTDPVAVPAGEAFKDLGFTSLTSVELRDRIAAATGLRLPAAYVFRHPTAEGIAGDLLHRLAPADGAHGSGNGASAASSSGRVRPAGDPGNALLNELARLEATLADAALEDGEFGSVTARLEDLLAKWKGSRAANGAAGTGAGAGSGTGSGTSDEHEADEAADRLRSASADQVFDFIDNELGVS